MLQVHTRKADLAKLVAQVDRLGKASQMNRLMKELAEEAVHQAQTCFEKQRDPYGNRWKPSKRALRDGGKTLRDTSRLHNSIRGKGRGRSGFEVHTNVAYAGIHNDGGKITKRVAQRFTKAPGKRVSRRKAVKPKKPISAHSVIMPRRQFIPRPPRLGPYYLKAMGEVVREFIQRRPRAG